MISRPSLDKPRIRPAYVGGYTITSGYLRPLKIYTCYGFIMLFEPGRPRINEVSVIGNTVQDAYENFMRIYGHYFPEQRDAAVSTAKPDSEREQWAGNKPQEAAQDELVGIRYCDPIRPLFRD